MAVAANSLGEEVDLTPELIQELDKPGPRYTSYPPVPYWSSDFGPEDYRRHLELAARKAAEPLSLYLHLPFCSHRCLFCGCNVVISRSPARTDDYLKVLARELETVAGHLDQRRKVCQLQLGGGTPTHLTPDQLSTLMEAITAHFEFIPGAELGVEAHPVVTTPAHLERLAELGFNRLSLGVQDFDPRVQAAIDRRQSVAQTASLVELARQLGFGGVNLDLIYGLPHQSPMGFGATLEEVARLRPDRLALYSFAYLPEKLRHQTLLPAAALPTPEGKIELFLLARRRLLAAGYRTIGFDHYALPGDSLTTALAEGTLKRGFMGYTTLEGTDLVGVGVSSISEVAGGYAQNYGGLRDWTQAVEREGLATHRGLTLNSRDKLTRQAIMDWLCKLNIDATALEAEHGSAAAELLASARPRLEALAAKGLITPAGDGEKGYKGTPLGRVFARVVAMALDSRLDPEKAGQPPVKFSRTV